ncbi:hypothetical protein PENSTE_c001G07802 [Penicillium steckii]|uniref:Uncharacterized protein n=1 Tax=Penicillium steckii TaxID=303698 RepID=A0A1V6TY08_9EURO|nr:hypothetical protein PENSTE_c001G07802 [Penicillium steckii]
MYGQPPQSDSSQPEWRLPPRPARTEAALPPPPPPPHPTNTGYNPGTYGPISSPSPSPVVPGSTNDPRTWGVRYNQQVHPIHAPPPLPPRPSSTNEQPYAYTYSQPFSPPPPPPPAPAINTSVTPTAQDYESFGDVQPVSASSTIPPPYSPSHQRPAPAVPAPPPKIPQGYQYAPAQQSNIPEQPPLLAQGAGPAATQGSYEFRRPRLTSIPTSSSALGPGTPSDWEHLGPTPGDFDDSPWFPPRQPEPMPQEVIQTPPGYSSGFPVSGPTSASTSGREGHAAAARPHVDTNYQHQHIPHNQAPLGTSDQFDHTQRHDSISPISPMTIQGTHNPPPPARMGSTSSGASMRSHADSIDNVIDAWVRPLASTPRPNSSAHGDSDPRPDQVSQGVSQGVPQGVPQGVSQSNVNTPVEAPQPLQTSEHPTQDRGASPPAVNSPDAPGVPPVPRAVDPYEDLDPWFKSSLTRYVATLRKEAVADSDEERYKIFTAFMAKETKLREILYNIEPVPQPAETAPPVSTPTEESSSRSGERDRTSTYESGLIPVETEEDVPSATPVTTTEDGDDIDDAGSEYSAGGRPILGKQARRGSHWTPKLSSLHFEGGNTDSLAKNPVDQSSEEHAQVHDLEPLTINPPRPIYTPFQYTEGPQRGSDKLRFDRPAYQAYSDLRASAVNGRIMSNAPAPKNRTRSATLTSASQNEHDETFLGLIRHKSSAYVETANRKSMPSSLLPEGLRQGHRKPNVVEELRAMVWTPLDKQSESSWHVTIREGLEKFPDDFSYIQHAIDEWESAAKARKQDLEQERAARQEESEEQIDKLFNEKEIGYADIHTLEEDFRQTEARVQLDEERREVEDFNSHVFGPLDEKLKGEISALRKSYDSALHQLERDQKGKTSPVEQCSPSVTMKMINEIHSKLELRFQKRLEIALDSERRRKKAERRPLVFIGDMASLRKLDGDFDRMEKRNILEAAKDRDDRANRLMDSFDDAILHGLGMNQGLLDELVSKVARLEFTTLRASGIPDSEVEQILKSAATFAASLRTDSEAILRCSGIADMALNDADYNVSVAEARYANSDEEIFNRLEDEKKKEDAILETDLHSKLMTIKKSPAEIEAQIQHLLQELADAPPAAIPPTSSPSPEALPTSQPSQPAALSLPPLELRPATVAPSQSPAPPPTGAGGRASNAETEHQERLRKALEQAKKRNAERHNQ